MSGWELRVWSSCGHVAERKVFAMVMICSFDVVTRGSEEEWHFDSLLLVPNASWAARREEERLIAMVDVWGEEFVACDGSDNIISLV